MKAIEILSAAFKREGIGGRGIMVFVLALVVILLTAHSCRTLMFSSIDFDEGEPYPGGGIEVSAQYLTDPEEIDQLFHVFLPDSGIVPVQVGIKNRDTVSVLVYQPVISPLKDRFGGVRLEAGDTTSAPMSVMEVMQRLMGEKASKYRRKGFASYIATKVLPAFGAYYLFDEATRGRVVKALTSNSFFPANSAFFHEPVRLEPGAKRVGYLFFPAGVTGTPYTSREVPDKKRKDKTEIKHFLTDDYKPSLQLVIQAIPMDRNFDPANSIRENLPYYDIKLMEPDDTAVCGLSGFLLREDGGTDSVLEMLEPVSQSPAGVRDAARTLVDALDSGADLAGAVRRGDYAACAVNFTRKSRVYLLHRGTDGFQLLRKKDHDSKVIGLAASERGLFTITESGFCVYSPFVEEGAKNPYLKLGTDIDGVFIKGKELNVFSGDRRRIFSTSRNSLFEPAGEFDLSSAKRRFIGDLNGRAVFVHAMDETRGDTLVLLDPADGKEEGRVCVQGGIEGAWPGDNNIMAQLGRGLVIRYIPEDGGLAVDGAALLASKALQIRAAGRGAIAFCENGQVILFDLEKKPRSLKNMEKRARVLPAPPRKEIPKKKKDRRTE